MHDIGRQLEPRCEALGEREELAGLRQPAHCPVDLVDQALAAALRQTVAWQCQQLANGPDAYLLEECILSPDDADWQPLERQAAAASTPQRRARRRGGGKRCLHTDVGEAALQ